VRGVAKLRGRLLPLMDLCGFVGHELSTVRKQRRVLVVDHDEVFAGLLVDEVLGLQHFAQDSLEPMLVDDHDGPEAAFVKGRFGGEREWQVFSPFALARSPGFMDVAI